MIYQGDALSVLKKFGPESVDCCITSPPYWALRNYKSPPQIWDGIEGCAHEWQKRDFKLHAGRGDAQQSKKYSEQPNIPDTELTDAFCAKCNAWKGELGLEPTFNLYLNHLVQIFQEVKRVLKKTGTCWVVLGDTYEHVAKYNTKCVPQTVAKGDPRDLSSWKRRTYQGVSDKSLCMIPERFALRMIDDGWILRNKIIWYKPNCMPSSAKDRFTVDWEYVLMFVKSNETQFWTNSKTHRSTNKQPLGTKGVEGEDWEWKEDENGKYKKNLWHGQDYFFETQYEPLESKAHTSGQKKTTGIMDLGRRTQWPYVSDPERIWGNPLGRIKRCVWKISTKPFSGAHFAVFPPDLIEPMIKAGCPEQICSKCGEARHLVYEETRYNTRPGLDTKLNPDRQDKGNPFRPMVERSKPIIMDCGCGSEFKPGVVLDPFCGAGTTGLVAKKFGREFIGIELNPDYIKLAEERLSGIGRRETLEAFI